ncbi:MAG: glycosyltransferase family 2 protein [Candidatus Omnitrophica bacterium]|nr:glycosyltransferase family 2 protein [Candidatus Omnitrophota bacterium]
MISVIIPTFNRAGLLKKAIESVFSQTYQDFELIVIDDGSWDDTARLVADFTGRLTYIKQSNKGPSAARNLGIRSSGGEFVAFLDSDDWWDREKLALQIDRMQKNPSYLVSHTQEIWYKNGKLLNQKHRHRKFHGYIFDNCLPLCVVSMSTVMIRRGLFDEVGLFDEGLRCCEDYDFWLRVSHKYPFLLIDKGLTLKDGGRIDQASFIYRQGMDKFRIHSILKIIKSGGLDEEQMNSAIQELEKKCNIYGNGCIKYGKIEEARYYLQLPEEVYKGVLR